MKSSAEGAERLSYCRCWVRSLSAMKAYGIRWGAHDLQCPAYQRSKDPVDHANDSVLRQRGYQEYEINR